MLSVNSSSRYDGEQPRSERALGNKRERESVCVIVVQGGGEGGSRHSRMSSVAQCHEREQRPVKLNRGVAIVLGAEPPLNLGAPGVMKVDHADEGGNAGLSPILPGGRAVGRRRRRCRHDGKKPKEGKGGKRVRLEM